MNSLQLSPLKIENLVKTYGKVQAVKNVSLDLRAGEIFGLLGPNGAGKTSLISCVVSLEKPTSGEIFVDGHNIQTEPILAKQELGYVPQEVVNHGFFDVFEILQFHSGYYGLRNNDARITELLKELNLYDDRHKKVRQLSGGMKRRLMIAKALVHNPKILLLDEPTAGVDIELRENLWRFVKRLKSEGTTILLTTHHLEEAEQLCDRVAIIHEGEIKKVGPTQSLIRELTQREIHIKKSDGQSLVCIVEAGQKVGQILKEKCGNIEDIVDITMQEGTLEDAFRRVIRKNPEENLGKNSGLNHV